MDRLKEQTFIKTTKFSNVLDTMFKDNKIPVREHPPLSQRASVPKQLTRCNALERMTVIVVVHSRDRYNISNFPLSISYSRYIHPRLLGIAQINFTTCS